MQNTNLIDDLLTHAEKAFGSLFDRRHDFGKSLRKHARAALRDLAEKGDLVTRSEFDAALAMLAKSRAIQEDLSERLDALESKMNQSGITMNRASPPKGRKAPGKKMKTAKPGLRSVKQGNRRKRG